MSDSFRGLEELEIRNLGVIESSRVEFAPGLNVLTGETGAGKTMVLTALSLIMGGKSDADRVRTGTDRLMVSGHFAIEADLAAELDAEGVDCDDRTLLISRTITQDGKSRISLGGAPSTNARVSELAQSLIEVHAQNSSQRLMKQGYIRSALDKYGATNDALVEYQAILDRYQTLTSRITKLKNDEAGREKEIALLKEFSTAFRAVDPRAEDLVDIEVELTRLESVDELEQAVSTSLNYLDNDEVVLSSILNSALKSLHAASGKDKKLEEISGKLSDDVFALTESISALARYLVGLDADPAKLDYLQNRKAAINSLIKKFGIGSDREAAFLEIIERGRTVDERIKDLVGGAARIEELEKEKREARVALVQAAQLLSSARIEAAKRLSTEITAELASLSMPHARIVCYVVPRDCEAESSFQEFGIDEISLLFASHEGSDLLALNKAASGGELSRVMLAIEVVLATSFPVPTYIFDEVDAGVGGKAAMEVGQRLAQLAKFAQVIVVTHLAQVAVWADRHLVVSKNESGIVGISDVRALEAEERKVEIARMLSGQESSKSAQEHAQELLELVGAGRSAK